MKNFFTLLFIITAFSARGDYWTQKADFGGAARNAAVGFSIGNKGYIGTGHGVAGSNAFYSDFWEYNPITNIWTQKANFGGTPRHLAVGFSINNKGYIGCGQDTTYNVFNDFWEYDAITNTWTQKANFGGIPRSGAVGFSIGSKGYIGTGLNGNYLKDFWEYDPLVNLWTQKMDVGGTGRALAVGFSNGTRGYIGTGSNNFISGKKDFWVWNPNTNVWTQKAFFGGGVRVESCGFWLCPFGYLGLGTTYQGSGIVSDFWKYNSANNTWSQAANFGGGFREFAVAFTIENKAYVGTGWEDSYSTNNIDFWEYTPDSTCATGIEELPTSNLEFTISPNPAKDFLIIKYDGKEKINLMITDVNGKVLRKSQIPNSKSQIKTDIRQFSKGIYFVEASNGKQKGVKKFLKE